MARLSSSRLPWRSMGCTLFSYSGVPVRQQGLALLDSRSMRGFVLRHSVFSQRERSLQSDR
eukprot:1020672-Pyramimonas_sp.AAC.1